MTLQQHQNDPLEGIFSNALRRKRNIISNRDALRSDYVPEHLPFRTQQLTTIGQLLSPILSSSRPSNLLVYGKTGTGKTAVTRYVTSRLAAKCESSKIPASFVYCNTKMAGTEYRVLSELASGIGLKVPFTGLAVSEVLSRIQAYMKEKGLHTVLVMDEIDFLVRSFGDDLLYDLTSSSDKIAPGFLSLIGISNDLQFKEELGARVLSRLSEEELVFPPYSATELKTILVERAGLAFNSGAYNEEAINLCAALSGSEHGDARRAVDLLRIASEVAEREGAEQLEEKHVRIALQKIDQDRVSEALKTLPLHAKLVLLATMKAEDDSSLKASSGAVYERYCALCTKSGLDPLTTRRVSGLLTELDTLGLVSATVVNYGRYGRTKKITPQISHAVVEQALSSDDYLKHLIVS
ncbi:MAG TPA: orc1/cdc6 family replication initiation protein [Nitrososphaerales archaeon]|nr:orc1/cdc6 family replication initiation protein [Nitrososphaerales archaeon]